MNKYLHLATATIILAGMFISANAYNGKMLNAKAVSVQARHTEWWVPFSACETPDWLFDGSLMVYTIENSAVKDKKTIYNREQGPAQYPAFNLAGTRIAFFRINRAPAATGSACVSATGGKSHISVINPDGTGLTDLCELPGTLNGSIFPLDWPAGDWIYYEMPHADGSWGLMIWRVNANTKVSEKVCNVTNDGSDKELMCSYFQRFTMALDGKYAAFMTYPKYGCDSEGAATQFFSHVNGVYRFPPPNGNLGSSMVGQLNGCNASVSPSGRITGNYFAGWHDDLKLGSPDLSASNSWIPEGVTSGGVKTTNFTINTMETWAAQEIGNGAETIRWSTNSDKWVLQGIGQIGTGHASGNITGCNQVVANWVDKVAINISKNPKPYVCAYTNPCSSPAPANLDQSVCLSNDPGDLWVIDAANNPNGDRYEDVEGVWHAVDGTAISSDAAFSNRFGDLEFSAIARQSNRELSLHLPHGKQSSIAIIDITGKSVTRVSATGTTNLFLHSLPAGAYFVSIDEQGSRHRSKLMIR